MTLTHADELADKLLTRADQVARRDHLAAEVGEIVEQHGKRESDLRDIEEQEERLRAAWRTLWQPCSVTPLDDAAAMCVWRERYGELTEQHTDLASQLAECQRRSWPLGRGCGRTQRAALEAAGWPSDQRSAAEAASRARAPDR